MPIARATTLACVYLLAASAGAAPSPAEAPWPHVVQPGDTLIGIRDTWMAPGSDWRTLQRLNHVPDPKQLQPGSTVRIPAALLRRQPVSAEVVFVHGQVQVERAGAAAQPLQAGAQVAGGDLLLTGPQSSAVLRFVDGARVIVRPDSRLRVEHTARLGAGPAADTRLRLDSGAADSSVPRQAGRRYEVRTPVANLGVRGTEFRTRAGAAETTVEVLEGTVAADAASGTRNTRAVPAGQGLVASAGALPAPQALPPAPSLAGLPARVERLPLQLAWAGAAARHRAQVLDAQHPERLLLDGVFDGPAARWADDLPDGAYLLRVRGVGAQGLEGLDATAAFTLKARPEPPFATTPRPGARAPEESWPFAWTTPPGAARYRLQVADTADFAAPRVDRSDITGHAAQVALPVGTHHWRLASIRADGDQGPWGDAATLTRVAVPPAPAAEPPQATDGGMLLRWRESPGATRYQVQVAADAGFAQPLHDQQVDTPRWLLPQPEPGTYFVRVRALSADGFTGPYGVPQQVEVPHSMGWWLLLLPALLLL